MKATSSSEKPSSDNSRKAWRGSGVMLDSRRSDGSGSGVTSLLSLIDDRIPDLREQPEQAGARAVALVEQRGILQQRLQHRRDIGIARGLVSGQRTGIAPQQRQVFGNNL